MSINTDFDVIIIGAGAAGMMCAAIAGQRGRRVWLVDHAKKIGEKIRISGGGRCNFTNIHTSPVNFLSQNPHFCKSALKQYTPGDFIKLVEKHGIQYHEKKLGQLFCNEKAQQIIDMLRAECDESGVRLDQETTIESIAYNDDATYTITTSRGTKTCSSLVIATGGLSIPKIGATKFAYDVAKQFNIDVIGVRAGLVPLTFQAELKEMCKSLSGLSVEASVTCGKTTFAEGLLFTHRGLSGPSILQISSYWKDGEDIIVNLAPDTDVYEMLKSRKTSDPKQEIQTTISSVLPKRLADHICVSLDVMGKRLADLPNKTLMNVAHAINHWRIKPCGTEGYRTAEVTLGGINTNALSSKTMEVKAQKGLFFIGESIDVTGHLGGFNFQWAWSSGYAAGAHL